MKNQTKLLAALTFLATFTANAAVPLLTPVTQLEVGKTYVFDNARSNGEGRPCLNLCDNDEDNELQCSNTINNYCVWIIEQGSNENSFRIKNVITGKYLFSNDYIKHSYSTSDANDLYIFTGKYYENTISIGTSPDQSSKSFLTSYTDNEFVCTYRWDSGSEWYAYEVKINLELPSEPIEKTVGKVKYIVGGTQFFPEAVAIGVASGNFSLDGLEIADYITYEGVDYPVTVIYSNAFRGITGFKGTLSIGKNVRMIGSGAFFGCTGFTSLILPNGLTHIGSNAFRYCSGLIGALALPQSLQSIGNYAFSECSGFNGTLALPQSLQSIGDYVFYRCSGFIGTLELPDSLTAIGNQAFADCRLFSGNLILPQTIQSIGNSAFYGCRGFTGTLDLPENLISVGSSAFVGCKGFTGSLEIPECLTSIGASAFRGCSGFDGVLSIPASITSILDRTFADTNFEKVISHSLTPPECATDAFSSARKDELQVPADAITAYMLKSPWTQFANINAMEPLSGIEFAEADIVCPLGATVKLKVNKIPFGAIGEITFTSSDSSVATVDAKGVVTGVSEGYATIVAMCGPLTATCNLTVEDPKVAVTAFEMEGICGKVGDSIEVRAKVIPDNATDPFICWTSSNPEVAAVDTDGVVRFNSAGSTVVTAECQDLEFSVTFLVEEVMARALNVFPVEAIGGVGQEFSLLALHEPENTTNKSVIWESSNPGVAVVNDEGRVSLMAHGTAQITAHSGEHMAVCNVMVNNVVGLTEKALTGVVIDIVDGGIVVRNAPVGESITIYTLDGKITNGAIVEDGETKFSLATGIYIVKVSPTTVAKVMIK